MFCLKMEGNTEQTNMNVKMEDFSWTREYGVTSGTCLLTAKSAPERQSKTSLKDELKSKILARRQKEGKSHIEIEETVYPKNFPLTEQEIENRDKRRLSNRLAARKCRLKKQIAIKESKTVIKHLLKRRQELMEAIPELEKEIADVKYLWRLMGVPGTIVDSGTSNSEKSVSIKLESEATGSKQCRKLQNEANKMRVSTHETDKECVVLKHCRLVLIIPAVLNDLQTRKRIDDVVLPRADKCENVPSDMLHLSEPDKVTSSFSYNIHDDDMVSKSSNDFDFRRHSYPDGHETASELESLRAFEGLSSSQSSSSSQYSGLEGYEEMKEGEMTVSSEIFSTSQSDDEDSDVEVIGLEEGRLVIDLNA